MSRKIPTITLPWETLEVARRDKRLQRWHWAWLARFVYRRRARDCPKCGKPAKQLAWFYYRSPDETWKGLCGYAGWVTVCDDCRQQVDFFVGKLS